MTPEKHRQLIEKLWYISEQSGLSGLRYDLIDLNDTSHIEIQALIPTPGHAVLALFQSIKEQVSITKEEGSPPPPERLFDIIMAHFDVALPHRQSVRRLWQDIFFSPFDLWTITPHFSAEMDLWLDQSGIDHSGLLGYGKEAAFKVLFTTMLKTWLDDDTPDQSKTMVALDQGIKRTFSYFS